MTNQTPVISEYAVCYRQDYCTRGYYASCTMHDEATNDLSIY